MSAGTPSGAEEATAGWTQINVALPLPMDVATTLMTLIGTAYPSAVIDTKGGFDRYALSMRINPAERAKRVSKKVIAELVEHRDPETSIDLTSIDDGWVGTAAPEELGLYLGGIAHEMFTKTEGAINYVEWDVRTADDDRYLLSISKSKGQTPGAMYAKEKAAHEETRAELQRLRDTERGDS